MMPKIQCCGINVCGGVMVLTAAHNQDSFEASSRSTRTCCFFFLVIIFFSFVWFIFFVSLLQEYVNY